MAVEITPRGTRGQKLPSLPRPLTNVLMSAFLAIRRLQGMPLIQVTTEGARTGLRRTVPLRRFDVDENAWMVVASLGGAVQHPAWYFNMARNPERVWVELDGRQVQVTPRSLHGAEREQAWARVVAEAATYAEYQAKTDREIPVVLLSRTVQQS